MDFHLEIVPSVVVSVIILIALTGLFLVIVKRKWVSDKISQFKSNAYVITAACTIILSLSAFLISVYLIYCCGYCRREPCCNSDSIVVAAFGVLVTLLVGWQIYKTVDVDKKIDGRLSEQDGIINTFEVQIKEDINKKVKEVKDEFDRQLKGIEGRFDQKIKDCKFISEATILNKEGGRHREQGEYISALRCYMRALNFVNHISEKIEIEGIISNIEFMQVYMEHIKISSNERDNFIKVLQKSEHPLAQSLIDDFIMKLTLLNATD
jgi:hypothetical protein